MATTLTLWKAGLFFVGLAWLFGLMVELGCNRGSDILSGDKSHKIFRGVKGVPVSFEYPTAWRRGMSEASEDFADVMFFGPDFGATGQERYTIFGSLSCAAPSTGNGVYDYASATERIEKETARQRNPDLKILENVTLSLDGNPGRRLTYSRTGFYVVGGHAGEGIPFLEVASVVAVDYGGRICDLSLAMDAQFYDEKMKADLDHIVETWKFIK